jgi:hypothetical protein
MCNIDSLSQYFNTGFLFLRILKFAFTMKRQTVIFLLVIVLVKCRQFDKKPTIIINKKIEDYFNNVGSGLNDYSNDDDDYVDVGSGFNGM